MSLKDRHHSITVRGLVCPSEWDIDNNVSRVSIFTFNDDEYEIEPLDAGQYLLEYTGQEVMARGNLIAGFKRRKVLYVKSFTAFAAKTIEAADANHEYPSLNSQ